jgi:hypothetical protein
MAWDICDSIYCKVMMISVCDMQSKGMEVQCILWRKLNAIIEKKGLGMPVFKGFMADWCTSKLEFCSHCLWD